MLSTIHRKGNLAYVLHQAKWIKAMVSMQAHTKRVFHEGLWGGLDAALLMVILKSGGSLQKGGAG